MAGIGMLAAAMIAVAGCAGSSEPHTTTTPETATTTTSPVPTTTVTTTPNGATAQPCAGDTCADPTHGAGVDPDHPPLPGPAPGG